MQLTEEASATLSLLCDADGTVIASTSASARFEAGSPIVQAYAFDHGECDRRDIQRQLKIAAAGKPARTRQWMRVGENELVRVELHFLPMRSGEEIASILIRIEPTGLTRRRERIAPADEPQTPGTDSIFEINLPVALLRIDPANTRILAANAAFAGLIGRDRQTLKSAALVDLVHTGDRRPLQSLIDRLRKDPQTDRTLDISFRSADTDVSVSITLIDEPGPPATLLAVVRDRSAETSMAALMKRADELADLSVRNDSRLRTLQRLVDACPIGLAVFEGDTPRAASRVATPILADANADSIVRHDFDIGLPGLIGRLLITPQMLAAVGVAAEAPAAELHGDFAFTLTIDDQANAAGFTEQFARRLGIDATVETIAAHDWLANADALRAELGERTSPFSIDLLVRSSDLSTIQFLAAVGPVRDGRRNVILIENARVASLLAEIESQRVRASRVFDGVPVGLLVLDESSRVTAANAAAAMLLGSTSMSLVGRPAGSMFDSSRRWPGSEEFTSAIRTGMSARWTDIDLPGDRRVDLLLLADQSPVMLAVIDRTNELNQADLAERFRARAAALDEVVSPGWVGWDMLLGTFDLDARCRELLGITDATPNAGSIIAAARAEDRDAVEHAIFDALEPERGGRLDVSFQSAAGRPVRLRGVVSFSGVGAHRVPARMTLAAVDQSELAAVETQIASLTEQIEQMQRSLQSRDGRLAELDRTLAAGAARFDQLKAERDTLKQQLDELDAQLRLRTAEINALVEASPDAVRILSDGVVRHNQAAVELFGTPGAAESIASPAAWLEVQGASIDADDFPISRATAGEFASSEFEFGNDDDRHVVQSSAAPIVVDGVLRGVVAVDQDKTAAVAAGQLLDRANADLDSVFESPLVAAAVIGEDGTIERSSARFDQLAGITAGQSVDGVFASIRNLPANPGEIELLSGRRLIVSRVELGGGRSLVTLDDRSETADALARLAAIEATLDELTDSMIAASEMTRAAMIVVDDAGVVRAATPAARSLLNLDSMPATLDASAWFDESRRPLAGDSLPWRTDAGRRRMRFGPGGQTLLDVLVARVGSAALITLVDPEAESRAARQLELQADELRRKASDDRERFVRAVQLLWHEIALPMRLIRSLVASDHAGQPQVRRDVRELSLLAERLCASRLDRAVTHTPPEMETGDLVAVVRQSIRLFADERHADAMKVNLPDEPILVRTSLVAVRHVVWLLLSAATGQRVISMNVNRERVEIVIETEPTVGPEELARSIRGALVGGEPRFSHSDLGRRTRFVLSMPLAAQQIETPPPAEEAPLQTLLIEDHESTSRVLSRQLARSGCIVHTAGSLAEAETILARQRSINLVLCDLTLPDEDPCAWVSRLVRKQAVAVIALSPFGGSPDLATLDEAGFVGRLVKPVDLHQLAAIVDRVREHLSSNS